MVRDHPDVYVFGKRRVRESWLAHIKNAEVETLTMFASHAQPHSVEFPHSHKAYMG